MQSANAKYLQIGNGNDRVGWRSQPESEGFARGTLPITARSRHWDRNPWRSRAEPNNMDRMEWLRLMSRAV
jgi:hypothetical protein